MSSHAAARSRLLPVAASPGNQDDVIFFLDKRINEVQGATWAAAKHAIARKPRLYDAQIGNYLLLGQNYHSVY